MTRLLGQSPAGLSATGESDVRNYYDMIAARQELDLRPQLERIDRLICWSEGVDPGALAFAFRPLWQMDEAAKAALALSRAQATQVYAGLQLWPDAVTTRLTEAQLVADGTYPNAAAVFAEAGGRASENGPVVDYAPSQARDPDGRWTASGRTFELSGASLAFGEVLRSAAGAAGGELGGLKTIAATTKNFRHACKKLKLDESDASDALHAAKNAYGLSASEHACSTPIRAISSMTVRSSETWENEVRIDSSLDSKRKFNLSLRLWSHHVSIADLLKRSSFEAEHCHNLGETIVMGGRSTNRVARRHYASVQNFETRNIEGIANWLVETNKILDTDNDMLLQLKSGQMEGTVWIAIFCDGAQPLPHINLDIIEKYSRKCISILCENYTDFDLDGIPRKTWLTT